MIIAGTSITGSWMFWSGVGFVSDIFPKYHPDDVGKSTLWWIFLVCTIGMSVAAIFVQKCMKKKNIDEKNADSLVYDAKMTLD